MAKTPDPYGADLEFRNGVIKHLIDSVDCTEHLGVSLEQFLGNITAGVNHKHLAYHLFCIVNLYIAKQTTLDQEQMSAIRRIIEQLREEWSNNTTSLGCSSTQPHTSFPIHSDKPCAWRESFPSPRTELIDATEHDVESVCEALNHVDIAHPSTPDRFVREDEKYMLKPTNFHEAVESKEMDDLKSQYPFGHRVMRGQGWLASRGLGPDGLGIPRPLDTNLLIRDLKHHESPHGLGYVPKTYENAHTMSDSTKGTAEKTEAPVSPVKAWQEYVADHRIDDRATKTSRGYEPRIDASSVATALTDDCIKATVQDQYVINDIWKNPAAYKGTTGARGNAFSGILGKRSKESPKTDGRYHGGCW
ncbi:hypothetical protein SAMD00023353_0303650 [Rosellinia necatrix]|uniref:G-patch domain-containing protein n=1 Tax=Rosellinia necatrix TaxID=77044 RepID=A0A1W2TE03_ROSNE|nr:hypothetical protein SAMD00023353_0303650 [Rosellinia necatrix]